LQGAFGFRLRAEKDVPHILQGIGGIIEGGKTLIDCDFKQGERGRRATWGDIHMMQVLPHPL
jgi:hypothetical protein